jgi:hypothetical protein
MKRLFLLPALALLAAFGPGDRSPTQLFERPKSWIPERKPVDPLTAVVPDPRDRPEAEAAEEPALAGTPFPSMPSVGECPADHVVGGPLPPNPLFGASASLMIEHREAGRYRETLVAAEEAEKFAVCSADKLVVEISRAVAYEGLGDIAAQLRSTERLLAMPYVRLNPANSRLVDILEHDRAVLRRKLGLPD